MWNSFPDVSFHDVSVSVFIAVAVDVDAVSCP